MKKVVITGASRGIGKALAKKFLDEGHEVFVIARTEEALKEIGDDYPSEKFRYAPLDLTLVADIENVLDYIYDWESVDILFNNAGYLVKKPFKNLTKTDFVKSWEVNFLAPAFLIKSLMPKFILTSHIINISTMGAVQGSVKFPELSAYGSSKAALINLTEILAEEFKESGPKINCVALGAVQTEMLAEAFPGYQAPLNPEEMANFLYEFGINGHNFFNGKILQSSVSTP